MRVLCGTSGYDYEPWRGSFYPADLPRSKMLPYYASRLPAVEINYSFRRKPTENLVRGWAAQVPEQFRFALKAWQRITHHARLRDASDLVSEFNDVARALAGRLGPVLYQLPPNLLRDDVLLREFLVRLPREVAAAFEFRHESWFADETFRSLSDAGAALCVAESDELLTPRVRTAPFGYLRLRKTQYARKELDSWADWVRGAGFAADVFAFFKHEDEAKGPRFAKAFAKRFSAQPARPGTPT
jgi:uncharacterized protein YecE (DUF72 family)